MEELIKKIEELKTEVQYWKNKYKDLEERSNELLSRFGD